MTGGFLDTDGQTEMIHMAVCDDDPLNIATFKAREVKFLFDKLNGSRDFVACGIDFTCCYLVQEVISFFQSVDFVKPIKY